MLNVTHKSYDVLIFEYFEAVCSVSDCLASCVELLLQLFIAFFQCNMLSYRSVSLLSKYRMYYSL